MPGPSSSCVPWSSTPPGAYRPSPISRCGRCCLQARQYLGHPETYFFRGYLPTAHSLACLRIAESVTVSGARLATGRAGSPFAGRVSHPLDDKRGFMKSSHTPFPLDQPCLVALTVSLLAYPCRDGPLGLCKGTKYCIKCTSIYDKYRLIFRYFRVFGVISVVHRPGLRRPPLCRAFRVRTGANRARHRAPRRRRDDDPPRFDARERGAERVSHRPGCRDAAHQREPRPRDGAPRGGAERSRTLSPLSPVAARLHGELPLPAGRTPPPRRRIARTEDERPERVLDHREHASALARPHRPERLNPRMRVSEAEVPPDTGGRCGIGTFTNIDGSQGALRRPSPSYSACNALRSSASTRSLT